MIKARHVICALGKWQSFEPVEKALSEHPFGFSLNKDYSILQSNPRMQSSFQVNQDKLPSSMTEEDWKAVDDHSAVAYILSPPIEASKAELIAVQALRVIISLFQCGATAIQSESAGLAHGKKRWLNLAAESTQAEDVSDLPKMGASLYYAWVQKGIVEQNRLNYTLGMHLLGHRDIEYVRTQDTIEKEIKWIDLLGLYLLFDRPTRPIKEGEGFTLDGTERKIISVEECKRKATDSFQYNPFGYFRLNPEKATD